MTKDHRHRRPRVHLAATPGGHLDLLMALAPTFERFDRTWVCAPGSSADALRDKGEEVIELPRFHGLTVRNLGLASRAVAPALRERPRLVVTAGSGSVVPFCAVARAMGARMVFIETMARVTDMSDAGRLLSRMASSVLVQWPELQRLRPNARVCRPQLIDAAEVTARPSEDGVGTFAAVGTHVDPFDRMVRLVDEAVGSGLLPKPAFIQTGQSTGYRPRHLEARQWMTPDEMDQATAGARFVVCHAGSGVIARALKAGITPLVVPRRADLGEHVDDHQFQITHKLAEHHLVVPVLDQITQAHIDDAATRLRNPRDLEAVPPMPVVLAEELRRLGYGAFVADA